MAKITKRKAARKTTTAFNVSLGKTLIAAAWVDGKLDRKENECLKSLLLRMPGISFNDWRKLKIFMAYPVSPREQLAIVEEFAEKVYVSKHRKEAMSALVKVIKADGKIDGFEEEFAREMNLAMRTSTEDFLRRLKYFLFQSDILNEKAWKTPLKGRERFINEFFDNPIYFVFRKALLTADVRLTKSKEELQKICLYAAILCWLANVDKRITFSEIRVMRRILIVGCGLKEDVAKLILEVAFVIDVSDLQLSELASSLAKSTKQRERNLFFAELSRLVAADHKILPDEIECLRTIALYLRISERTWLKVMTKPEKGQSLPPPRRAPRSGRPKKTPAK
jgi:uncharacterized tellurite resistance protein B-like protein